MRLWAAVLAAMGVGFLIGSFFARAAGELGLIAAFVICEGVALVLFAGRNAEHEKSGLD
jgi:hypothetical protein